jgi:hypothetical protein
MDKTETINLGKQIEKLMQNKLFQEAIVEGFIAKGRSNLTEGFTGSVDEVEGLKAIAYFDTWLLQSMEQAKILQGEHGG